MQVLLSHFYLQKYEYNPALIARTHIQTRHRVRHLINKRQIEFNARHGKLCDLFFYTEYYIIRNDKTSLWLAKSTEPCKYFGSVKKKISYFLFLYWKKGLLTGNKACQECSVDRVVWYETDFFFFLILQGRFEILRYAGNTCTWIEVKHVYIIYKIFYGIFLLNRATGICFLIVFVDTYGFFWHVYV